MKKHTLQQGKYTMLAGMFLVIPTTANGVEMPQQ
jgi:hypothetical protein